MVVSHVLPFPPVAGQRRRVALLNEALRTRFSVRFATPAAGIAEAATRLELASTVDEVVAVEPAARRPWEPLTAAAGWVRHGWRTSNTVIGGRLLTADRLRPALGPTRPALALLHYPHATASMSAFRDLGVPVVLDMHDRLSRSRFEQLAGLPSPLRHELVRRYDRWERAAWRAFDAVIALNAEEATVVAGEIGADRVLVSPMGVDLQRWPCRWSPPESPTIAYYGGLGNDRALEEVTRLVEVVLPSVRRTHPDVTLTLIGSGPSERVRDLAASVGATVTGFLDDPGVALATCSLVVCPFRGRYGFRSRLVETWATGVPVVASDDAVAGMAVDDGSVVTGATDHDLAEACTALLGDERRLRSVGAAGRALAERHYSFEATYGALVSELATRYR